MDLKREKIKASQLMKYHVNNTTIHCNKIGGNCCICPISEYKSLSDGQCRARLIVEAGKEMGYEYPDKEIHMHNVEKYKILT